MRKRVLYAALGLTLSFLLLFYWCFCCDNIATYGKGPIKGRNTSDFPVPDTVYIHDTVKMIIAPTATSETFVRVDTVWFERVDKMADVGLSNGLSNDAHDIDSDSNFARLINEVSKSEPKSELKEDADTVGKLRASYGQVSDSVPVLVPITQRVYKDSTCTVWVSGYNPTVDSVHVYRSVAYYPVVSDKEYDPPNIVVSIGPYMGFGNKGFNYGIALTVGVPIWTGKR